MERLPIVSRAMCDAQRMHEHEAWQQHVALRDNVKPNSTEAVKTLLFLSWCAYLRHALLLQQMVDALDREGLAPDENGDFEEWPHVLALNASEFSYVKHLESRCAISPGRGPIGSYTVAQVMLGILSLRDALDAYGWTPSASLYFKALLWRYALTIVHPGKYGTSPGADYEATSKAEESPFLVPAPINREYLNIGERIFFHMLWRMRALRGFIDPSWFEEPIFPHSAKHEWAHWRMNHGAPGLVAGIMSMLKHKMIGDTVDESVTTQFMDRFVMPGECEQLRFDYPDESDTSATNTIFRLRVDFHSKAKFLYEDPLQDTLNAYVLEVKRIAARTLATTTTITEEEEEEESPFIRTRGSFFTRAMMERQEMHERVILLLAQIAFDTQCTIDYQGKPFQRHAYLDNQSVPAPSDRPPLGPQATLLMSNALGHYPLFLCIWGTYIIINKKGKVKWVTPHLIDALAVWMSLGIQGGHLKAPGIMLHWQPMLTHLPSLSL